MHSFVKKKVFSQDFIDDKCMERERERERERETMNMNLSMSMTQKISGTTSITITKLLFFCE